MLVFVVTVENHELKVSGKAGQELTHFAYKSNVGVLDTLYNMHVYYSPLFRIPRIQPLHHESRKLIACFTSLFSENFLKFEVGFQLFKLKLLWWFLKFQKGTNLLENREFDNHKVHNKVLNDFKVFIEFKIFVWPHKKTYYISHNLFMYSLLPTLIHTHTYGNYNSKDNKVIFF